MISQTPEPQVFTLPEFISSDEQQHLLETATQYRNQDILRANPAGPNRFFLKLDGSPYCDDVITAIAARIVAYFGLANCRIDPMIGWVLSYIEPGGFIQPHTDVLQHYEQNSEKHFRCNVVVQGTDPTCRPRIGDRLYEVPERGIWAFHASDIEHSTQVIAGDRPRIIFGYGFRVPADFRLPSPP